MSVNFFWVIQWCSYTCAPTILLFIFKYRWDVCGSEYENRHPLNYVCLLFRSYINSMKTVSSKITKDEGCIDSHKIFSLCVLTLVDGIYTWMHVYMYVSLQILADQVARLITVLSAVNYSLFLKWEIKKKHVGQDFHCNEKHLAF